MAEGFLGRWSQRKQAVREGKVLDEPVLVKPVPAVVETAPGLTATPNGLANQETGTGPVQPPSPPPPSLEDVQRLTTESDFKPFVARDVAPEVRNAAMKKLFSDPQFNVMDGLDIYIDDYSKPDPLPESMLRQMASAQFLNLFESEAEDLSGASVRDDANTQAQHSVAQSAQPPLSDADLSTDNQPQAPGPDHDHTDLRLQPNDAAGPDKSGRGTE
ncbi:MAG: DUF3306 domain-containing protein [Pseudomonadota bacterium]